MSAARVRVYKDLGGEFRYTAYAANNRRVGVSEEGYEHLRYAVEKAHETWPDAEVQVKYGELDYVVDFSEPSEGGEP